MNLGKGCTVTCSMRQIKEAAHSTKGNSQAHTSEDEVRVQLSEGRGLGHLESFQALSKEPKL